MLGTSLGAALLVRWACAVLAAVFCCSSIVPTAKAAPPGVAPEVREPFFEFMLAMAASDSLGSWTGDQLRRYVLDVGRESRLPLAEMILASRQIPTPGGFPLRWRSARVSAVWRLEFASPQHRPMPYSILGYHPGSLQISKEVELTELVVPDRDLTYGKDGRIVRKLMTDLRVFALTKGSIVLDADAWLDALLGSGLDDSWALGFVTARENGRLMGLGVSVNRDGGTVYGEFDFAADEVLTEGRPLLGALTRMSRTWLNVADGYLPAPWPGR